MLATSQSNPPRACSLSRSLTGYILLAMILLASSQDKEVEFCCDAIFLMAVVLTNMKHGNTQREIILLVFWAICS